MRRFYEIPFLNNLYEINRDGIVRNVKTKKILKGEICTNGYRRYKFENKQLGIKGYKRYLAHRLVAMMFLHNTLNKPMINHINSVRDDNRVENLEWVTHSENMKHGYLNNPTIRKCLDYGRTQTKNHKKYLERNKL